MNKLTKTILTILPVGALTLPGIVLAQGDADLGNLDIFIQNVQQLINALIPLVAAIALLAFFWGLAKYVFQADDDEAKEKGKNIMIGGIIALFLIAAVGGIVEFIADAFGLDQGETITPSGVEGTGGENDGGGGFFF